MLRRRDTHKTTNHQKRQPAANVQKIGIDYKSTLLSSQTSGTHPNQTPPTRRTSSPGATRSTLLASISACQIGLVLLASVVLRRRCDGLENITPVSGRRANRGCCWAPIVVTPLVRRLSPRHRRAGRGRRRRRPGAGCAPLASCDRSRRAARPRDPGPGRSRCPSSGSRR